MRKLLFLTLTLLCLSAACTSAYQPGDVENTNPTIRYPDGYPPDVTDYSQITAYPVQESYPLSAEEFAVYIQNPSGEPFYFYEICFLEQKVGSSWKRLNHQPQNIRNDPGWMRSLTGGWQLSVRPEDIRQKLKVGQYRFVVFVGNEVLYSPFALTKD
jgi:hypothetical protein